MTMSEHAWVLENLASYSAGGLEAAERERLEQHTAACVPCARALHDVHVLDQTLEGLFADVRPGPALEDGLIHALRAEPLRGVQGSPFAVRVAAGAAAVLLLGILGASVSSLLAGGSLPFPGATGSHPAPPPGDVSQYALGYSLFDRLRDEPIFKDSPASPLSEVEKLAQEARGRVLQDLGEVDGETLRKSGPLVDAFAGRPSEPGKSEGAVNGTNTSLLIPPASAVTAGGDRPAGGTGGSGAGGGAGVAGLGMMPGGIPGGGGFGVAQHFSTYRNDLPGGAGAPTPSAGAGYFAPDGRMTTSGGKDGTATLWGTAAGKSPPASLSSPAGSAEKAQQGQAALDTYLYFKPADPLAVPAPTKPELPEAKPVEALKSIADAESVPPQQGKEEAGKQPDQPAPVQAGPRKIIIRSGAIEFEVESFDAAVAAATKLVSAIPGGFLATVNSEKLPNGKVRGSVVVRVPPDHLDGLVLDLRKELGRGGELKGQRIGSQDITKQYTDLESRLRAARAMEERLLQIIKTGKGEIKDLLLAEKELGVWRTRIEEVEGELRYYSNLVALSTLTITLYEKEIRSPFAVLETERVQMGVEVEDVDQALRAALAAVADAKGRVTKSELKQLAAGQFNATLHFEVAPEAAGPVRDRLRQLGIVARLEIDRLQETQGGSGRPQDAKTKRNDTQFFVGLYNVANVQPRETVHLALACVDAEAVYQAVLRRVEKAAGRVLQSNLNRQKNEQSTGAVTFDVKAAEAGAVLLDLKALGEVLHLQVTENPDTPNVTRSKRGFQVELLALGRVEPRETVELRLATRDVPAAYRRLQDAVGKAQGRVLNAQLNEQNKQNVNAQLDFDVRRTEESTIDAALRESGDVYSRTVSRAQDSDKVLDSKVRWKVSFLSLTDIPPRETYVLGIEVTDVDQTAEVLTALVGQSKGRTAESHVTRERTGQVTAKLVFDVPLTAAPGLVERFKSAGTVRVQQASRNPQVPDSPLALARLDVTLSSTERIVPTDAGLWPQVRTGLAVSFRVLAWSLTWVVFGVCVVLPWALVGYGVYRLVARLRRKPGTDTPAA
jgi:hypothetical protein